MNKMQIFAGIIFSLYTTFVSSADLKPGKPVPHAEVLDEIFTKFLGDSYSNNGLFDLILGGESNNTDITNDTLDISDIKILDVDSVRKIINSAKKKHEQQEIANARRSNDFRRRESYDIHKSINNKTLELMLHEIYLVKDRMNSTLYFRKKYREYHSYQIALMYGAGNALLAKMESLLANFNHFKWKTHFIWWLIIYEKILACNIDINNIVERIFHVQKMFAISRGPKPKTKSQLQDMANRPNVPKGALQSALDRHDPLEDKKQLIGK
nr:uncharacterized protein LOC110375507 [Helicoverpa armigera]XP_049707852.1 uncharacterized protein LOC126056955 [Helicoverpa armigera]